MRKKKVVFLQGAFDILTAGHVRAFKKAKALGGTLIVALNTDSLLPKYKHRSPIIPYEERRAILSGIKYIDKVVPISTFGCIKHLKKYKVDIYTITREWESTHQMELGYMKKKGGQVVWFAPEMKTMCSSDIRKAVINLWKKQNLQKSRR
jgi:cytidyltransferase-like protein